MEATSPFSSNLSRGTSLLLRTVAVLAALALSACASSVKIKLDSASVTKEALRQTDLLHLHAGPPPALLATFAASSRELISDAKRLEFRKAYVDAAACYLKAAVDVQRQIVSGKELHNHSLSRFVELWMDDPRRDGSKSYRFECGGETLEIALAADSTYKAGYFDRGVPALSVIETKGIISETRAGWGAAIVGIRERRPEREAEMKYYPLKGLHTPVTLTMDSVKPSGGVTKVTFSLRNPMLEQTTKVGGRTFPVEADFSAPVAVVLNHQSEAMLGLEGFFKADQREKVSGIFLSEPYDSKRIPILLIHGLISVPMIWRDIIPELMSDPGISRRYQVMVFGYPSGLPIIEAAQMLRNDLAAMRKHYDPDGNDPLSRNMVVAGHSMGGILTHTLVVEMDDHLWRQFNTGGSLDQLPISSEEREGVRDLLFFKADPAVHCVIYFSAPHRGAKMAEKGIAGTLSKLAKLPALALQENRNIYDPVISTNPKFVEMTKGTYTSAQSLLPGAPMVAALDAAPYRKGVVYHSVMGDRGRGDTPNSSDGVVEYWSSRQDGAASELIVPTHHGSYKDPKAIEQLKEILRQQAGIR